MWRAPMRPAITMRSPTPLVRTTVKKKGLPSWSGRISIHARSSWRQTLKKPCSSFASLMTSRKGRAAGPGAGADAGAPGVVAEGAGVSGAACAGSSGCCASAEAENVAPKSAARAKRRSMKVRELPVMKTPSRSTFMGSNGRSRFRDDRAASKAVRKRLRDLDVDEVADEAGMAREIDHAVVLCASGKLGPILLRRPFHEDALAAADHGLRVFASEPVQPRLEPLQPRELLPVRRFVAQVRGRRSGARAEDEAERAVEAHVVHELHGLVEVGAGLPGKADDEVAGDRDVGTRRAQAPHDRAVLHRGVVAFHRREHAVGARLHGQMHPRNELRK